MGGEEDGQPFPFQFLQDLPHRPARPRVQPGGQLVQEHKLGVWYQRKDNKQPLPLPSRKTFHTISCLIPNPEAFTKLPPARRPLIQAGCFPAKLRHPDLRLVISLLKLDAHFLEQRAPVFFRVMPKYQGGSPVRLLRPQDTLNGRALPGPVCPQQPKDCACLYRQIQIFKHGPSLIDFGKVLRPDSLPCSLYRFSHPVLLSKFHCACRFLIARSSMYPRSPLGSSWMRGLSSSHSYPITDGS